MSATNFISLSRGTKTNGRRTAEKEYPRAMKTDTSLESHINRPYNNRLLPVVHGSGTSLTTNGLNAVKLLFTVGPQGQFLDVSFRAYGDRVLTGCASYSTLFLRDLHMSNAEHLTGHDLAYLLDLPDDELWCAEMVIKALHAAIEDYCSRPPAFIEHALTSGKERNARMPRRRGTERDRAMLRPGETLDELYEQREWIFRCLHNLDLVAELAPLNFDLVGALSP